MKNFEALAVGVIAGIVASAICCDKDKKPCPPRCPKEESVPPCDIPQPPKCKKCYYQKYYR